MPVRHIVMFGVKEDTSEEQMAALKEGLLALPGKIDVIKSHQWGLDLKLPSGQNHPGGKNRTVMWSADFDDAEAFEVYAAHADHVAVINTCIKPIMEPGTRAAIQYAL
ncbi:unnamed protein product [Polarella glacialis]|uniref:Stress-response A/B barrel domain-containing protein n=1 Tax=Polarella glacialis TaxID=89957 RepID=A0A813GKS4_POLGL|nr:unnamed protein product [Polarella glacialis]CAE8711251.1 unnamed protein product [Polarella glacialis]|mmetsp:Transcript_50051/g.81120  ORF Transcript_50051/g.81120 Transcript_50051/m.81120 type:complete len:108 (-) Transcript_50051:308-631(-)